MKKYYLLTPGPTPVPPEVSAQSALPVLHHRTSEFGEIFDKVLEGLKYVYQTKNDVLMLTSSGTGAMESAVVNTLSPGDKAIVVSTGAFGDRWGKICEAYNVNVVWIKKEWGDAVSASEIKTALQENKDAKVVFIQHTDTSTTLVNPLKEIGPVVAKTDAICCVDAVSGLGGQELKADEWKLDIVVSGSQKGLMTAPGLAFAAVSEKAWGLINRCTNSRFYFDYKTIRDSIKNKETPYTPAVSLFASLAKSLELIQKDRIENVWKRHRVHAEATRAGLKALGLKLFSSSPADVLTGAYLPKGIDGNKLVKWLREEHGVSIAGGQEHLKGKIVRLGHMGYMDQFDLIIGLTGLEWALKKFGYKLPQPGKAYQEAQAILAV